MSMLIEVVQGLGSILSGIINVYIWVIIATALMSFVRPDPSNPIVQTLNRLTEPVYAFIRKKLPFLVLGGIDLTPLVIILGLQFLDTFMMTAMIG